MKKVLLVVVLVVAATSGGCVAKYQVALTQAPPMPTDYKVGPADVIWIEFRMHPEFNRQLTVGPHGKITLPAIGEYLVFGKTADQIAKELSKIYAKMFTQPDVIVTVVRHNSKVVYVIGEVGRPGMQPYQREMRMLDAMMLAGGPTIRAAKSRIRVVRPGDPPQVFVCNFDKAARTGNVIHNPYLQYGDVIYVDPTLFTSIGYFMNELLFPLTGAFTGIEQTSSAKFTLENFGRGGLGR